MRSLNTLVVRLCHWNFVKNRKFSIYYVSDSCKRAIWVLRCSNIIGFVLYTILWLHHKKNIFLCNFKEVSPIIFRFNEIFEDEILGILWFCKQNLYFIFYFYLIILGGAVVWVGKGKIERREKLWVYLWCNW